MSFSSKDRELVEIFRRCSGVTAKVRERHRLRWGKTWIIYEVSFSSVRLAAWYQAIGITVRKSLTIGALVVPGQLFFDVVRGLLDGDGSLARYTDARGRHCFSLRFYSASESHLAWLAHSLNGRIGISGSLARLRRRKGMSRRAMFQLAYGREASWLLASQLYANPEAPRLDRKWIRWVAEVESGRI